jgi:hypothetical protein
MEIASSFLTPQCRLGVKVGHSAIRAQCPVLPESERGRVIYGYTSACLRGRSDPAAGVELSAPAICGQNSSSDG